MKKLLILILVMSLALMFIGCSDDKDDNNTAVTKASFKNQTSTNITVVIDGVVETVTAGETWGYVFNNSIFGDDQVERNVNYTVTGSYLATNARTVTIKKNKTTTVPIISEGGLIVLKNNHYLSINTAVIYQADGPATGSNILVIPLAPNDSLVVLKNPDNYRVSLTLANGSLEAINTFAVVDNQMSYATISAQKKLALSNQTNGDITFKLNGGATNRLGANQTNQYILGVEYGLQVEAVYNGLYIFEGTESYNFFNAATYEVAVSPDGGAIFVVNNTTANITEVYISPANNADWGPDYMTGSIGAGQEYAWTVNAGLWDVKLVDDQGYQSIVNNISVSLNQSSYVDYSDKAKTRSTTTILKNKAHYNYPVSGTKVEGN